MKSIEISIKENNLNKELEPIESKCIVASALVDEDFINDDESFLIYLLNAKWDEVRRHFLRERDGIPFTKVKEEE